MSCTINSAIQSVLKENSFYKFKPEENFIHITKDKYSGNNVEMSKHNIAIRLAKHLNKEFKAQIVDVGDMFFPTNSNDSSQGVKVQYTKKQAELVDKKSEENDAYNKAEYHRRKNQVEGQYTVIDGEVVPFTKAMYSFDNNVNYSLKAIEILSSDKAKQIFDKGRKNLWSLDKILSELEIPKEQKQLILNLNISDREQIILELASKYSYSVEINTAKTAKGINNRYGDEGPDGQPEEYRINRWREEDGERQLEEMELYTNFVYKNISYKFDFNDFNPIIPKINLKCLNSFFFNL